MGDSVTAYTSRPAWRNQWLLITVTTLWGLIDILVLVGLLTQGPKGEETTGVLVFWFGFLGLFVVSMLYNRYVWNFTIKGDEIRSEHGIVSRDMKTIRVQDLRNVNVKQSFFQRIFGIGDVEFSSSGGSGIEVTFFGIDKPMRLHKQVQAMRQGEIHTATNSRTEQQADIGMNANGITVIDLDK